MRSRTRASRVRASCERAGLASCRPKNETRRRGTPPRANAVNGQVTVTVPGGSQLKVSTPQVDHFLVRVVPPRARAWRMRSGACRWLTHYHRGGQQAAKAPSRNLGHRSQDHEGLTWQHAPRSLADGRASEVLAR